MDEFIKAFHDCFILWEFRGTNANYEFEIGVYLYEVISFNIHPNVLLYLKDGSWFVCKDE